MQDAALAPPNDPWPQKAVSAALDAMAPGGIAFYIPANLSGQRALMNLLRMIFIWWRGATPGTWLTTMLYGTGVGADKFGNRYFENKTGKRRWVIYNGTVEASRVPPDWHGWLHHTFREPPTAVPFKAKAWELEHKPNMTGTEGAYHPEGSLAARGERPPATGDYEAWKP